MIKKLETFEPLITSYPKYAHLFTMIGTENSHIPWIAKHLLLFHSYQYKTHCSLDIGGFAKDSLDDDPFPNGPLIDRYKIPFNVINFKDNIIHRMVNYIDEGFYICVNLNTENMDLYSYSLEHPVLVFGYDSEKEILFVNDFFPPLSKYTTKEVSYSEVKKGILESKFDFINLYKRKSVTFDLDKNKYLYKNILKDSLSKLLSKDFIPYNPYYFKTNLQVGFACGLDVYDELISNLSSYGKKGLHVLYDSKVIIYHCLSLLVNLNLLDSNMVKKYKLVIDKTMCIRNVYIKYTITEDRRLIEYCKSQLLLVKNMEKDTLEEILNKIS